MTMTFKGYILTDDDGMLVMQGSKEKRVATAIETAHYNMPIIYTKKGHARQSLENTKRIPFTPSANTYCKQYGIKKAKASELLHVQPCTVTIDY